MRFQDKALEGDLQLIEASLQKSRRQQSAELLEQKASIGVRARVRVRRQRLDALLAAGTEPGESPELALRASQLSSMAARKTVASALRRAVTDAREHRIHLISSVVPVYRPAVNRWSEALIGLAEALEQPEPVDPCGVARGMQLITDGSSPLYRPNAAAVLGRHIWWIADGLGTRTPAPVPPAPASGPQPV
jgi:hypothetical protein